MTDSKKSKKLISAKWAGLFEKNDFSIQDVVGYCMDNGVKVVHRVIQLDRENHTAVTKGDANQVEDITPVSLEQIEGRAVISIPYIGYGVAWIRSTAGIITIIFIAILLFWGTILKRIG